MYMSRMLSTAGQMLDFILEHPIWRRKGSWESAMHFSKSTVGFAMLVVSTQSIDPKLLQERRLQSK